MITLLEALVDGADGAYASKQDLRNLEHAMFSWSDRKAAYLAVQEKEQAIIARAMKLIRSTNIAPSDRVMDDSTIERCRRDMILTLRAYALAMLLQDEEMLKDRFLYWQKNVIQSMGLHHYQGVKFVLDAICVELLPEQANLFKPYFKLGHDLIMSN